MTALGNMLKTRAIRTPVPRSSYPFQTPQNYSKLPQYQVNFNDMTRSGGWDRIAATSIKSGFLCWLDSEFAGTKRCLIRSWPASPKCVRPISRLSFRGGEYRVFHQDDRQTLYDQGRAEQPSSRRTAFPGEIAEIRNPGRSMCPVGSSPYDGRRFLCPR